MDNKQTKARVNRILYVSMVLLLCALAIVIAVTSSVNRARREQAETTSGNDTTLSPTTTRAPETRPRPDTTASKPTGLDAPDTTGLPDTTGPSVVTPGDGNFENTDLPTPTLPTFYAPVKGTVAKAHDKDTAVYSATMDDWRVHLGVDIACNENDKVGAAADGTVSQIWTDPLMGRCISLSHNGGALTIYKNLDPEIPESLTVGSAVKAGECIGLVGDSAIVEIADEPHLHFEMTVDGIHVDPMEYFSPSSIATSLSEDVYE